MKVEVAVLGSPDPSRPYGLCAELRSCVKDEVAVLGSPVPSRPYGLCAELRSCVKVEVAVLTLRSLWT